MRCPILADSYASVGCNNLYIHFWETDRLSDLFPRPPCGKYSKCAGKRNLTCRGKPCGSPHHILLRYTHIKELVRNYLFTFCCPCPDCQISIKDSYIPLP